MAKYTDTQRERALAMLAYGIGPSEIGAKLGIPKQTISSWGKRADAQDPEFNAFRARQRNRFVSAGWKVNFDALQVIGQRIERAAESEKNMNEMLEIVATSEMTETARKECVDKLLKMNVENLRDITQALNTVYDKVASAQKTEDDIPDGKITVSFGNENGEDLAG